MADIVRTKAKIAVCFPEKAKIFTFIAGAAIEAGQPLFLNTTTKKVGVADANDGDADELIGIALEDVSAGQPVAVLKEGHVFGYTIAATQFAYVSDTVGELADAAGTAPLPVGRAIPLSDSPTLTVVLYVDITWAYRDFVDNT